MQWAAFQQRARDLSAVWKYGVVGAVSFVIDIAFLTIAWQGLGMPVWAAASCGFWASFAVNFGLNKYWTFEVDQASSSGSQLARYVVLVAANYLITVASVTALHEAGLQLLIARTVVLAILTLSTFVVYRNWVFAAR